MNTPRRTRLDLNEPAELAIHNALLEVEKMPADVRLTEAGSLLIKAKELVADFIDSIDDNSSQIKERVFAYWKDGTIEEMSRKRYYYMRVAYNPNLSFWSNEKSKDWVFVSGQWKNIGIKYTDSGFCESCGGRNCIC